MARSTRVKASDSIKVEGLSELSRSLKALDAKLPPELRATNKDAASHVAGVAVSNAYSLGGVAAKMLGPSIKASAGITSAGVAFGGPSWPAAAGAEFGAIQYKQFAPWRGSGSEAGYAVYEAVRSEVDEVQQMYEDGLGNLIKRVGLA